MKRFHPLHQTGTLAVLMLGVALASGVYLLLFYDVSAPYESTARLHAQWWGGRWIRSLHRYSSDAAVVAVLVHAVRMFLARRTWGPRIVAWTSGVLLVAALLVCGVSGLILAWDRQGQHVAQELVRLLDQLPFFSEPISRVFQHPLEVGRGLFFSLLFLHVAAPLGLAFLFLAHVSRLARPLFLPVPAVRRVVLGALLAVSVLLPVPLGEAPALRLPGGEPLDLFYVFWLPQGGAGLGLLLLAGGAALTVPLWRKPEPLPAPSEVDTSLCTGCTQCVQDCPFGAVAMVARSEPGRHSELVARVDPDLCVSCGICAGSCAPMGIGPPGRTGRDQLAALREFRVPGPDEVVLIACRRAGCPDLEGVHLYPVACVGALHTSVIEYLVRKGAGGVAVLTCPDTDCVNREGPKWLRARVHDDREAELHARVDRRRVLVTSELLEVLAFRQQVAALAAAEPEAEVVLETVCEEVR